jgi:hypothetical protein
MNPSQTMYSVFGIVITGEAIAIFIANNYMYLLLIGSLIGLIYFFKFLIIDFKNTYHDPTDTQRRKANQRNGR